MGILIPDGLAKGLKLFLGKEVNVEGVGGVCRACPTTISLDIGRGGRFSKLGEVEAMVLMESGNTPILLGRHPLFDRFEIIFREAKHRVILNPVK